MIYRSEKTEVTLILIPFLILYSFFNFKPIIEMHQHGIIQSISQLAFACLVIPTLFKAYEKNSLSRSIRFVLIIMLCALPIGYFVSDQSLLGSLRVIGSSLGICMYFWLVKNNISTKSLKKALLIIFIINTILHLYVLFTFPNNLFGAATNVETATHELENRGIIRVGLPAGDLVILGIFYILNARRKSPKLLIWLIPLFILLVMRGTRMPLAIAVLLAFFYVTWYKRCKIYVFVLATTLYFTIPIAYDMLLKSRGNNIIVNYVKMTNRQLVNANRDDIRIEMSKFYIFDFKKNFIEILLGNGIPHHVSSKYGRLVEAYSVSNGYYMADVGYVMIYIRYGLIGLIAYFLLLRKVTITKVAENYTFAKVFVLYFFVVSITGAYLVTSSMFLSFGLYFMEKERIK